ncbi:MAG: PH domain-containing protein [Myxococcota bacterium]
MGYADSNLMAGETIVHRAKMHWVLFVPGIFFALLWAVPAAVAVSSKGDLALGMRLVLGAPMVLALYMLLTRTIEYFTTELVVTSRRVMVKKGFIRRATSELNHARVEGFNVEQSILGRLLGFGTVVVNGTGGGKTPVRAVASPLEFRRMSAMAIDPRQE